MFFIVGILPYLRQDVKPLASVFFLFRVIPEAIIRHPKRVSLLGKVGLMVRSSVTRLSFAKERLQHADVLDLGRRVCAECSGQVVVLDLRKTRDATTASLAGLILLRRRQIQAGGDLLLLGLRGKAQYLYELLRLAKVLPRRPCIHPRRVRQLRHGRGKIPPVTLRPIRSRPAGQGVARAVSRVALGSSPRCESSASPIA